MNCLLPPKALSVSCDQAEAGELSKPGGPPAQSRRPSSVLTTCTSLRSSLNVCAVTI